jgi:hypothetical protein
MSESASEPGHGAVDELDHFQKIVVQLTPHQWLYIPQVSASHIPNRREVIQPSVMNPEIKRRDP